MQHLDAPLLEVVLAVEVVDQGGEPLRVEVHGHGVDGEVAAVQVELDRAVLHGRQGRRVLVVLEPGSGHVDPGVVGEDHRGGAELLVGVHRAVALFGQEFGEADAVALDDHVDVGVRHVQEQVADETAGHVGVIVQSGRGLADLAQQDDGRPRQHLSHDVGQVAGALHRRSFVAAQHIAAQGGRVVDQEAEQVGAGDHPHQALAADHRDEPLAVADDQLLDVGQRAALRQGGDLGGHVVGHGQLAELVKDGLFRHPPGDHAEEPLGLAAALRVAAGAHHRQHGDVVAGHQAVGLVDGHLRGDVDHRRAHQLAGHLLGADLLVEHPDQPFLGLGDGQLADGGGRGRGVTAAAEFAGHGAGVDLGDAAAGDQVGALAHAQQGKQHVDVLHHHQPLDEHREVVHVVVQGELADHHADAADHVGDRLLLQLADEADLLRGQLPRDELGDDVQVGAVAQQPGRGGEILGAGGGVEEAAGVLVDAQGHQGGLRSGGHDALLLEEADEDGGGGAEGLDPLQLAVQVVGAGRVVVVEVDAHPRVLQAVAHPADALGQAGVDDDQPVHPVRVDVADLLEFVDVAEFLGEVVADRFFLRPGEHQLGLRVEPLGGDHGRQAVEIGADVAGDDVHGRDYTPPG